MTELTIEVETTKPTMVEVRSDLEAGLKAEFPGGALKWRWEGDVLQLSGPGATGTIVLEAGRLVGRAQLKPPASVMRPIIEQKITKAMKKGAAA